MTIVFRTDASLQIGSGHVMRCLTLAEELRQRGADILFICREYTGNLIDLIERKGYPAVRLKMSESAYMPASGDVAHAAWLGVSWQQDAEAVIAALRDIHPAWLIVDHYALERGWEEKLRPHVGKIMVIDDLADRPHDCDLLLDQNLYEGMETRYDNLAPNVCQKLLGPRYALIRPEFAVARKNLRQRSGEVKRVIVFFGGVDPTNETSKAVYALAGISDRQFAVDVVVGSENPHKEQIQTLCSANKGFHYHCQVDNMAAMMAAADLAIGAGGTATWERCALGLPGLVVVLAENQVDLAVTGSHYGLFFSLGAAATVSIESMQDALRVFTRAPENLLAYTNQGLATVDARGAQRLAGLLAPPAIVVRCAELDDCDAMLAWRNADETRRYIFDSAPITLETHRTWFRKALENPDRVLLIGEMDGKPVGVLRYDLSGEEALISVYLVPGGQGQGIGTQLIRSGSIWLKEHQSRINVVNAEILSVNIASLRAFEQAGYREHHLVYQEVLS